MTTNHITKCETIPTLRALTPEQQTAVRTIALFTSAEILRHFTSALGLEPIMNKYREGAGDTESPTAVALVSKDGEVSAQADNPAGLARHMWELSSKLISHLQDAMTHILDPGYHNSNMDSQLSGAALAVSAIRKHEEIQSKLETAKERAMRLMERAEANPGLLAEMGGEVASLMREAIETKTEAQKSIDDDIALLKCKARNMLN